VESLNIVEENRFVYIPIDEVAVSGRISGGGGGGELRSSTVSGAGDTAILKESKTVSGKFEYCRGK
jgi:hypothetical protein